eukprot:GEMP01035945.1.p1 GENE.GEMP01035945.1~~GEMP01035945.1.p1  ORF type:complete len:254 (+),score=39.73 GEMP01035945.1:86-847(+)
MVDILLIALLASFATESEARGARRFFLSFSQRETSKPKPSCRTMLFDEHKTQSAPCHLPRKVGLRCCSPRKCVSHCGDELKLLSYDEANTRCENLNSTLCTLNQLATKATEGGCGGTGCGFNSQEVWARPDIECRSRALDALCSECDSTSNDGWSCTANDGTGICQGGKCAKATCASHTCTGAGLVKDTTKDGDGCTSGGCSDAQCCEATTTTKIKTATTTPDVVCANASVQDDLCKETAATAESDESACGPT